MFNAIFLLLFNTNANASLLNCERQALTNFAEPQELEAWEARMMKNGKVAIRMEAHHEDESSQVTLGPNCARTALPEGEIFEARNMAVAKMGRTLQRRKISLNDLTGLKVWSPEEDHHGHGHGHGHGEGGVWFKFTYNSGMVAYVQCHEHDHGNMVCHYKKTAKDEPNIL